MPARYQIELASEAWADLQSIFDYIHKASPQNARTVTDNILDAIDGLYTLASRFKVVGASQKPRSPVHAMVVTPFIVYYRIDDPLNRVFVLTIQHGARRQPQYFQ